MLAKGNTGGLRAPRTPRLDFKTGRELDVLAQRVPHRAIAVARELDRALDAVGRDVAYHREAQIDLQDAARIARSALGHEPGRQRLERVAAALDHEQHVH